MGSPDREVRYRDDMREGNELAIYLDELGDVYISVLPVGHKIGPTVRRFLSLPARVGDAEAAAKAAAAVASQGKA